jgi:hypothetical protein
MDLCDDVYWIQMAENRVQRWAAGYMVINLRVLRKARISWLAEYSKEAVEPWSWLPTQTSFSFIVDPNKLLVKLIKTIQGTKW